MDPTEKQQIQAVVDQIKRDVKDGGIVWKVTFFKCICRDKDKKRTALWQKLSQQKAVLI